MTHSDRRRFLKTCLSTGLAIHAYERLPAVSSAESLPMMSIARYETSPESPEDIRIEAERLTRAAIGALGGMSRFVGTGNVVWIKPNICFNRTPEQAANTNPHVIAALTKLCFEAGAREVHITNNHSDNQTDSFAMSGIQEEAQKAGAKVYLMGDNNFIEVDINGKFIQKWPVYKLIAECDAIINVPIPKHHVLAKVTVGMKNFMGIIGGQRNQFHKDFTNSIVDLAAYVKPKLIVLDAVRVLVRHGPMGGNLQDVMRKDCVAAGVDQVALDAFGTELIGQNPAEIGYIQEAQARGMGVIDYRQLQPKEITLSA